MNKKIFITGASGKLGHFVVKELLNKEYDLFLLCRKKIEEFNNPRINIIIGNILNSNSYIFKLNEIEIVLHIAGITHTNNIQQYYEVNSKATLELLKACKTNRIKRFIFVSTRAISEEGGHYCKSKFIAEQYVQESGLDWVIIRLAEVYGVSGKEGIDMIINNIHKFPIVPIIGDGNYKLAPVHISDAVYSIVKVVEELEKVNKIYNIAGPESFTYNVFINQVLKWKKITKIKVHIPVLIFYFLAKVFALVFKKSLVTVDQIPRLLCNKSDDISLAMDELSFNPIRFEEGIKKV